MNGEKSELIRIGETIYRLRKSRKMSQKELAEKRGLYQGDDRGRNSVRIHGLLADLEADRRKGSRHRLWKCMYHAAVQHF